MVDARMPVPPLTHPCDTPSWPSYGTLIRHVEDRKVRGMLGIFFLRDVGLRYRRVQGSHKETTALRKLTLMEGANFPRTPALDDVTLR